MFSDRWHVPLSLSFSFPWFCFSFISNNKFFESMLVVFSNVFFSCLFHSWSLPDEFNHFSSSIQVFKFSKLSFHLFQIFQAFPCLLFNSIFGSKLFTSSLFFDLDLVPCFQRYLSNFAQVLSDP